MKSSAFQITVLFVFGIVGVIGVLFFAGYIHIFQQAPAGGGQTILVWSTFPRTEALTNFIDSFNRANSGNVTLDYQIKDPLTYNSDLLNALASGTGPDVFLLPSDLLIKYHNKILPLPFTSYPQSDYQTNFIDGADVYLSSQSIAALPVGIDPLVMYYNKDLLYGAGIASAPSNWDAFLSTDKALTVIDKTNTITQSGGALGSFSNVRNGIAIFTALVAQGGNHIVYPTATGYNLQLSDSMGLPTPPAQDALQFFLQFSDPAKTTYSWNKALPDSRQMFVAGNLGTYFGFASELPGLVAQNPHLNFSAALFPQRVTGAKDTAGTLYGFAIAKNTSKAASSLILLSLLTASNQAGALAQALGLEPVRRDLLSVAQNDPTKDVFYRSAIIARPFLDPDPTNSAQIFNDMAESVTAGLAKPYDALQLAEKKLELLIQNTQNH